MLVHGEKHEAHRLKKRLESYFDTSIKFESPANWVTVEMRIKKRDKVKLYGEILDEKYIIEKQEETEEEKNVINKIEDLNISQDSENKETES